MLQTTDRLMKTSLFCTNPCKSHTTVSLIYFSVKTISIIISQNNYNSIFFSKLFSPIPYTPGAHSAADQSVTWLSLQCPPLQHCNKTPAALGEMLTGKQSAGLFLLLTQNTKTFCFQQAAEVLVFLSSTDHKLPFECRSVISV